jgi:hypothetical protein
MLTRWQHAGFNVHAATRVAANDEQGRLASCEYILRPRSGHSGVLGEPEDGRLGRCFCGAVYLSRRAMDRAGVRPAQPVAVRYGWANVPEGNLFNRDGLPASPFRTDVD